MTSMDHGYLEELRRGGEVFTADELEVCGVKVVLPLGKTKPQNRERDWQRRVIADLIPESPIGDAPEKTPFRILDVFSDPWHTECTLVEALDGALAPLRTLFVYSSQRGTSLLPLAFHVLAVKGKTRAVKNSSFGDATFSLLCSDGEGWLKVGLVERFVERFRLPFAQLDLAQQAVLRSLEPGWSPVREPRPRVEQKQVAPGGPFLREAAALLQRDLETLLAVQLTPADFFHYANLTLALHFGLYLPRLARLLNPAVRAVLDELAAPGSQEVARVAALERGEVPERAFCGSLFLRVLAPGEERPVRQNDPELRSFQRVTQDLSELHFSLLLFHRLRELTRAYLLAQDYDAEAVVPLVRTPSMMVERLHDDPEYRTFLLRAGEALALRFSAQQIDEQPENRQRADDALRHEPSGMHALYKLYQVYNRQAASSPSNSRAVRQGRQVLMALLGKAGEYGLVRSRKRVGAYFELGSGLLPVLMLLVIGKQERLRLHQFWDGLARYGLALTEPNRRVLLRQLKAMGLFERYSDAGEASYVRNPMTFAAGESR